MAMHKFVYMAVICIVAMSCGIVHCTEGGEDEEKHYSKELTIDNFDNAIKTNNHLVMFFAPWCGHCKRLHPLWEELAEMMNVKDDAKVLISKVDCTQYIDLCTKHEITGYPTLRFFKLGSDVSVKFKGTRDMPAITEFINQQLNSEELNEIPTDVDDDVIPKIKTTLVELTDDNFAQHVSSGNHFVKFYAPWCGHCQRLAPVWDDLAKSYENQASVSIAKIDCTVHRPICVDFEVKGYPTLLWIEDGKKIEKYSGSRDLESLKTYVDKMLGTEATKVPPSVEVDEQKPNEDKLQVITLSADNFDSTVEKGVTFVKFYAPWCGHCQELKPTWDNLAQKLHAADNGIKIAKVDCTITENRNLCSDQQVEGYPTLFAYKNGEKQNEYDGTRALPELLHYINKFADHDEL